MKTISFKSPDSKNSFNAAIAGQQNTNSAIILVHGFGVLRDSRGMFTEISDAFNKNHLVLSADYSNPTKTGADAVPFSAQLGRLNRVISYAEGLGIHRSAITLVGHSMGSLIAAMLDGEFKKRILLAPPTLYAFEEFIGTPGWKRPGSELNVSGSSVLARSDGSITRVSNTFWNEFRDLGNVNTLYQKVAEGSDAVMVFAEEDNVFSDQEAVANVRSAFIQGANHDFTGAARESLLQTLHEEINA